MLPYSCARRRIFYHKLFYFNMKGGLEMDKNIILKELARKLPETEGISYELQNDKLKVKVG